MTSSAINPMELRNGRTRLVVDGRTGALLRTEDAVTGLVHLDAARNGRRDGRLLQCVVPGDFWWSCCAESQEQADVRCRREGDGLVLEYPDLKAADGAQTGVSARVEIRPSAGPDEFLLTLHLENRGRRTVLDTTFPLLGGWHPLGGPGKDTIALGANRLIGAHSFPTGEGNYARNAQRGAWYYPLQLACPWMDVSGPGGGLSYINYMTEGRNGKFWIENLAGYGDDFRLMFGWGHLIALGPGASWTSPPMGLAVHGGDWRKTADRYAQWFDARHPPDYARPAIRSRIGFQNVFFRGFDGTPIRPLEAIPAAAAAGRKYGVDLLAVWDTLTLGNYARSTGPELLGYAERDRETIVRGLRQAEAEGTQTCALINFRHPNVAVHLGDADLANRIQRRYDGTFRTENWSVSHTFANLWATHLGPESYVFSPFSRAHRARVLRLTQDYLDLGYSSMFYDQPFEVHPDYGFMDQGCPPDATHHEALTLAGEVRRLLLARDGAAVIIGEECDIHATPYIDQWMSWSIAAPSPSLLERLELMRYAMPHTILSWVADHEPDRASLAFALGMQMCLMVHGAEATLEEEPAFAAHVAALAALRKATADRTVLARFIGRRGLQIEADDSFTAWAYDGPAGPAVIAAAPGRPAKGRITLLSEAFQAAPARGPGMLHRFDGSRADARPETQEFALAANEVAVWYPTK